MTLLGNMFSDWENELQAPPKDGDGGYYNAGAWALHDLTPLVRWARNLPEEMPCKRTDRREQLWHNDAQWVYQILSISSTLWRAQVLRFTNLTSDTLSLYQDPQNAGAVFQAFGCLWNDHVSMSEDNDHGLGISWPWTTWQPPALWKGWLSLWLVLDMVILIWHGQIISWIWEYET